MDANCIEKSNSFLSFLPNKLQGKLLPFQSEGIKFAIQKQGRCLIADEMGLGKTLQAISVAYYYKSEWPLLIIVPSTLKFSWAEEIERWLPELDPHDISVISAVSDHCLIANSAITIISYGLLSFSRSEVLSHTLYNRNFQVIIVDESHYIKNKKTRVTKQVVPLLQQANRCILLSGTPALSRPIELWTQLNGLFPKQFGTWFEYTKRYCDGQYVYFGKNRRYDALGASNLQELQRILSDKVMIRRLKADVLTQLPPKQRQKIPFYIKDQKDSKEIDSQFEEIRKMLNSSNRSIQDVMESNQNMSDPGGFKIKNKMMELYRLSAKVKIGPVKEFIKELLEKEMLAVDQKMLVFSYHHAMMDGIQGTLYDVGVKFIRIDGTVPSSERGALVHQFQTDPETRVAVLSIGATAFGITLTAANLVVFAELYWTPGTLEQCEDRAHRIGQKKSVTIQYLVAKRTMDEWLWSMLSRKTTVITTTLNGKTQNLDTELGDKVHSDVLSNAEAYVPVDNDGQSVSQLFLSQQASSQRSLLDYFNTEAATSAPPKAKRKLLKIGNIPSTSKTDVVDLTVHQDKVNSTENKVKGKDININELPDLVLRKKRGAKRQYYKVQSEDDKDFKASKQKYRPSNTILDDTQPSKKLKTADIGHFKECDENKEVRTTETNKDENVKKKIKELNGLVKSTKEYIEENPVTMTKQNENNRKDDQFEGDMISEIDKNEKLKSQTVDEMMEESIKKKLKVLTKLVRKKIHPSKSKKETITSSNIQQYSKETVTDDIIDDIDNAERTKQIQQYSKETITDDIIDDIDNAERTKVIVDKKKEFDTVEESVSNKSSKYFEAGRENRHTVKEKIADETTNNSGGTVVINYCAKNVSEESTGWTCTVCTFINSSSHLCCEVCLKQREQSVSITDSSNRNKCKDNAMKSPMWSCERCTLDNSPKNKRCVACRKAKPKRKYNKKYDTSQSFGATSIESQESNLNMCQNIQSSAKEMVCSSPFPDVNNVPVISAFAENCNQSDDNKLGLESSCDSDTDTAAVTSHVDTILGPSHKWISVRSTADTAAGINTADTASNSTAYTAGSTYTAGSSTDDIVGSSTTDTLGENSCGSCDLFDYDSDDVEQSLYNSDGVSIEDYSDEENKFKDECNKPESVIIEDDDSKHVLLHTSTKHSGAIMSGTSQESKQKITEDKKDETATTSGTGDIILHPDDIMIGTRTTNDDIGEETQVVEDTQDIIMKELTAAKMLFGSTAVTGSTPWLCTNCSHNNEGDDETCDQCFQSRPVGSSWICSKCSHVNPMQDADCDECFGPRHEQDKVSQNPEDNDAGPQERLVNLDEVPVYSTFKFRCSKNTERIYLYDKDGLGLNINFYAEDIEQANYEDMPDLLLHPANQILIKRFVKQWNSLSRTKQRMVTKQGQLFSNPVLHYESIKVTKSSTQRYTTKEDVAGHSLKAAKESGGSVRVISRPSKWPTVGASTSTEHQQSVPGKDGEKITIQKGIVQAVDADGNPLCLQCQKPYENPLITKAVLQRGTTAWDTRFCTVICRDKYWVTHSRSYGRDELLRIESGKCQKCGLNAQDFFTRIKSTKDLKKRSLLIKGSIYNKLTKNQKEKMCSHPNSGMFWQVDHERAVFEGGGQSDIDNLRTLCTVCHRDVTIEQHKQRMKQNRKAKAAGFHEITAFLTPSQ